jgi:hypothetical protein
MRNVLSVVLQSSSETSWVLTWHSDPPSDQPATTLKNNGHIQGVTSHLWDAGRKLPKVETMMHETKDAPPRFRGVPHFSEASMTVTTTRSTQGGGQENTPELLTA